MSKEVNIYNPKQIANRIFTIRGVQVMVDRDLAEMYQVEVKRLNEQVKRNVERFPEQFRFQLNELERNELVANCDRFEILKHSSVNPYAFTEQGVAMLSAVLRSDTAVKVSIQIINAFVEMRKILLHNAGLLQRVEKIESKLQLNDKNFERIFSALESGKAEVKQDVFFNGQIYDAYSFIIQLIEKAQKNIVLIDNYVDNSVLDMLAKKQKKVTVQIVTHASTPLKTTDISKFNQQYPALSLSYTQKFHDRFLVIDNQELYHIGASLKDLGKKCFAFSLIEENQLILKLLNEL